MTEDRSSHGRGAVVVGDGSGVGPAVWQLLARSGAGVVINPRNVAAVGGAAAIDVGIRVNCVGIAEPARLSIPDVDPEDWTALLDWHLATVFRTCRAVAPGMVPWSGADPYRMIGRR